MQKHVLIIDDDAAVRSSIQRVLEGAGYATVLAADGEQAITQFVPDQVELVLLDLNLPFRHGWDVFERLTTRYPVVPIIVITGLSDQYRTALAAGVSAFMEKPVDAVVLLQTMEELLAEPKEARLRRLCGYQEDTRHLRASRPAAMPARNANREPSPRLRLSPPPRRRGV
jgi:DNA-binding NtrC family response regulator